jgi:hypothetical protein
MMTVAKPIIASQARMKHPLDALAAHHQLAELWVERGVFSGDREDVHKKPFYGNFGPALDH